MKYYINFIKKQNLDNINGIHLLTKNEQKIICLIRLKKLIQKIVL
jgi:hypothetical protein